MTTSLEAMPMHHGERIDFDESILNPINGDPAGKNFLSTSQLNTLSDFDYYNREAAAAEKLLELSDGAPLLTRKVIKIVMKQPSTRTGGSMETAMHKLGGDPDLYSGQSASAESKGESWADTAVAFSTQGDLLATRTPDDFGPMFAAEAIATALRNGQIKTPIPVINLGDGWNEHPTQTSGDIYTISKHFTGLKGLTAVLVGDHLRYRVFHSFEVAASILDTNVVAVESPVAPVPPYLIDMLGNRLTRVGEDDLDEAMRYADILMMGRNPDEYSGDDEEEKWRSNRLAESYRKWIVDYDRLQIMSRDSIGLHPRPRRNELHSSVDVDPRMKDVEQMANMIPMRMAIIAGVFGKSLEQELERVA
jgi:aspartate carbamoyltransferase catalytic subunit